MIDSEKILAPLGAENPTGPDLRSLVDDSTMQAIEELRREADPETDASGGKAANWPAVVSASEQALATRSKDLLLAAWLTEALGRVEGFSGLQTGLRLVRELLDRYWDGIHPGREEAEIVLPVRAQPLVWLSAARGAMPSVRAIGFVGEGDRRDEWLGWAAYEEAQRVATAAAMNAQRHAEMMQAGAVTSERWTAAFGVTPVARLRADVSALRGCEAEVRALGDLCNTRFGSDEAPNFIALRDLLSDIREHIEARLPSEDGAAATVDAGPNAVAVQARAESSGPVATRQEALARLREVADFFRRSEPHSPMAHLVERAVRWGGMSFEEVLLDVMKGNDLSRLWDTLGITPPSPS